MVLKKVYYPDSKDVEAEWEELPDGRQHGKYCTYHRNGKTKQTGENHYDERDGLWHEFDDFCFCAAKLLKSCKQKVLRRQYSESH